MMTDAGQEIQLQCSPVRRAMGSNEYQQSIGEESEVLSFPLASPKRSTVTPTTRPALVSPSDRPAAKTAPRRRLECGVGGGRVRPVALPTNNGNKSLLDASCDTSYDCANTTRDSSFDCCHNNNNNSTNLTSLLGLSAINNDSDDIEKEQSHLLDENDDVIVPKILFPEEMMHGTSGPMDGNLADDEEFHGDDEDDASDIDNDDDDEDFEYSHSDYLSANHSSAQAVTAHSSPFKDLTNIGGGGKNQQKLKEVDSTEVTTSLSASFFHNLSSTFADSIFCSGADAVNSPGTPRASPVRCRMIPRASPSLGTVAAATPHRPHHLPRPSPSRSLVLSTPMRTETPSRLAATSDTSDNANRSTLSEMEEAVREHFRRLDCYANTGTPIRTPEKCAEKTGHCDTSTEDKTTAATPQKQQLMELYEDGNDAHVFHSAMTRNKFCNRAAQPVRLQAERIHSLYFHGTLPSSSEESLGPLEMAADATLSSRLKRIGPIGKDDEPSFEISRASSFNNLPLQDENGTSGKASANNEEQDADLSTLIGCIEPISMLNGDVEHGLDQMKANIPSDDTCYDSDPGDIEQALARREHFQDSSEQRGDCDGHGTRRRRRKLASSIAMVQVRCVYLVFFLFRTIVLHHVFSYTQNVP